MGIPIIPPVFGDDCLAVFPAGETPQVVWSSFSEIKKGNLWAPGDPPPPNGIHELVQIGPGQPCKYAKIDFPFFYQFSLTSIPIQQCAISFAGQPNPFFLTAPKPNATYHFTNGNQNPIGFHYYSGFCQVAFVPPSPSPSLTDLAQLFGLGTADAVKADFWPVTPDFTTRLVSHQIPTNCLIKQEN